METERPSYNDLITTTFGGVAVGEALFRLSSHMLEPSASGGKRFVRELAGGLIAPTHGLTRVVRGKTVEDGTSAEPYQVNGAVMIGPDRLRSDSRDWALRSMRFGFLVEYGRLGPSSKFHPFDWFLLTSALNLYEGKLQRGTIDLLGLVAKWNFDCGGTCLVGINQHYAYVDTSIFKVGTSSIGASLMGDLTSRSASPSEAASTPT